MDTMTAMLSLSDLAKNRPAKPAKQVAQDVRPLTARISERMWVKELVSAR